jgi:hypothetical protein
VQHDEKRGWHVGIMAGGNVDQAVPHLSCAETMQAGGEAWPGARCEEARPGAKKTGFLILAVRRHGIPPVRSA